MTAAPWAMPLVFASTEPAAPSPDAGAYADEDEGPTEHPAPSTSATGKARLSGIDPPNLIPRNATSH